MQVACPGHLQLHLSAWSNSRGFRRAATSADIHASPSGQQAGTRALHVQDQHSSVQLTSHRVNRDALTLLVYNHQASISTRMYVVVSLDKPF